MIILDRDVSYLKERGLIDYSLLLAIELSNKRFKPEKLVYKRLLNDAATRRHSVNFSGR